MSSANMDCFTSSSPPFSCLIALDSASSTVLIRSDESELACFGPDLSGNTYICLYPAHLSVIVVKWLILHVLKPTATLSFFV